MRCAALLIWLCGLSAIAYASDPKPDRTPSTWWAAVSAPEAFRTSQLVESALREWAIAAASSRGGWETQCNKLTRLAAPLDLPGFAHKRARLIAGELRQHTLRLTHLDNAIARANEALALSADHAGALHILGLALRDWERPLGLWTCTSQRRDAEAIAVLERLRQAHPSYEAASIAFDLAIIHTRMLRFADAARCYAEGAPLELDQGQQAVVLSNWAEVTMLSGDPVSAVPLYERALRASRQGAQYLLPLWGLAVALDRLGEHDAAIEHATRALHAGGGTMAILHDDGVFFEPQSEIHYYEALGHEAAITIVGGTPEQSLTRAIASWRAFFETGGGQTPWAASARDNLQRLEARVTQSPTEERRAIEATPQRPAASARKAGSRALSRPRREPTQPPPNAP